MIQWIIVGIVIGIIGTFAFSLLAALLFAWLLQRRTIAADEPTVKEPVPAQQWRWN